MMPRRVPSSNTVLKMEGGTEDSDLYCRQLADDDGDPLWESVWIPNDEERQMIAEGANLCLQVWGFGHPPVSLFTTDEQPISSWKEEDSQKDLEDLV